MPIALLAGAFGQGNLGDDALLQAFVQALPGVAPAGDDRRPGRGRTGGLRAGARPSARPRRGCRPRLGRHPDRRGHRVQDPPSLLRATPAGVVGQHLGAGRGVVGPPPSGGHGRGRGRPPGSWRARALSRFIVKHADLLVLRDEESAAEMFRSSIPGPFRVGADPAWTLVVPPDRVPAAHDGVVRVVPSHLANGADGWAGMVDRLADTLRRLLAVGLAVELQAWQHEAGPTDGDDGAIIDALVDRLGPSVEVVPTPESMGAAVESMIGTGTVLSFRFHALIAAAAAGVPTVAVTHEAKLGALTRRLEQRAAPVDFEPAVLATQVANAIQAPGPAPAAIKEQIARAEEGFLLLRVLLGGGRSEESDSLGALPLAPALRSSASPSRVR